ncbi:DEAD/DEAH box helicase [Paenibacillus contaminans]|uniref:Helicase SNF n=1 Tax=Paenibacillus contaminans TaxID=450362 RepID=A0A329MGG4_9BACL|nr:DEAD/DEAH box helicase [Paenibacillus contaminans]RAV19031.1 helicase SNF [Paenibacillus contaminans]
MNYNTLSNKEIKRLCGGSAYQRGENDYFSRRVTELSFDPDKNRFDAVVSGDDRYNVYVIFDKNAVAKAGCTCPAFGSYYVYCKHVAAVLFQIRDYVPVSKPSASPQPHSSEAASSSWTGQTQNSAVSGRDTLLTRNMIALFTKSAPAARANTYLPERRQTLQAEFIFGVTTASPRKSMMTLEMKIGPKRPYVVQKLKQFLESVERGTAFEFSKHFTYDPLVHAFKEQDMAVIRELIETIRNEYIYRSALSKSVYISDYAPAEGRTLFIPPATWERLQDKLATVTARFEHGGRISDRLELREGQPPISFQLSKPAWDTFQLDMYGMEDVTVLESYGCTVAEGVLYRMKGAQQRRLAEMKEMFRHADRKLLLISESEIESFMQRVIPGLKQIGSVAIAKDIAGQIVTAPLRAKLYLDRDDDRLIVKLTFAYGEIVFDPFSPETGRPDRTDLILARDTERESRIMDLLEQAALELLDDHYAIDGEDEVYRFLYELLPALERLVEVYATAAVKGMKLSLTQPKVTVNVDERTEWLEVRFDMDGIGQKLIRQILRSLVEKRRYHRLPDGAFVSLEEEGFKNIAGFMKQTGFRKSDIQDGKLALPLVRGLYLLEPGSESHKIKIGKPLRELLDNLRNPDNLEYAVPEQLNPILRDYQKYGYQWMRTLSLYRFGGILADDMGLGKTLQSIALMLSAHEERTAVAGTPVLIVAPASLTYNWRNELKRFAPGLRTALAVGDKQEREDVLNALANIDVLVTSYPLLRRDTELYEGREFRLLILDEAQAFKNHATQTAQAVKSIMAAQRFALTGTPMENSLEELWSIFDVVFPELFDSKRAFANLTREEIAKRVRPFILRRMKKDVLSELPDKIESLQTSELTKEQKQLYAVYLAKLQKETAKQLEAEGFQKSRIKILAGLTRLRQICCHPSLFVENYDGGSGKLEQLLEIVEECMDSGKRMLIFSQFTEMLGIIRRELADRGIPFFYLDGSTPSSQRVELCQRYNDGEREIFLISMRAGGTGLNLTGADTVVLYDLWWNPAVEQQAADRAHRIGQKNVVQVIRLVSHGTIEEKVIELQQRKKDMIDAVITPGEEALSALTEQEIRELLLME